MKLKHRIKFFFWSRFVRFVFFFSDMLNDFYDQDSIIAWDNKHTMIDKNEWLHRRWYPSKYSYEK